MLYQSDYIISYELSFVSFLTIQQFEFQMS